MNKMILGLLCLLTTCMIVQAKDVLSPGKWVIEQVTSEKNTDGTVRTTIYKSAANLQSHIPCPQELEIQETCIVLYYPDGWTESAEYTFKDDQLIIHLPTGDQTYKCDIKDDAITLTSNYKYANVDLSARSAKKTEYISEKRTIIFKFIKNP